MPATWPGTIEEKLLIAGFSFEDDSQFIEQPMDVGPPKVRRRSTLAYSSQTCAIIVDATDLATLKTFYNTTLTGGTGTFNFTDPLTSTTQVYRFRKPYTVTPVSGTLYRIEMDWQKEP